MVNEALTIEIGKVRDVRVALEKSPHKTLVELALVQNHLEVKQVRLTTE